ncbi:MAG: alpha/beta fold hydrolase [Nannocystaceae bacterium]|nr:alpha/beta fold hydrolase [Nannocystaceae bacterium]
MYKRQPEEGRHLGQRRRVLSEDGAGQGGGIGEGADERGELHEGEGSGRGARLLQPAAMPTATAGALQLNYDLRGEGTPLLMVMGLGAQKVLWPEALCDMLARRGFAVARFDNRDVGASTRLDHLGVPSLRKAMLRWTAGLEVHAPYGLSDLASDAFAVLDALGWSQAHVMGASMGGMVAQQMAIMHPERIRSLTSIMSHPGDKLSKLPHPSALKAMLGPRPRTAEQAGEAWVRLFREIGSGPPHFAFEREFHDAMGRLHFERGPSPQGFVRQSLAILASPDRREGLGQLDLPVLVVHGTADRLVRYRGGVQTARALRVGELLSIEGMGHDLPREMWPRLCDAFEHTVARSGTA